MTCLGAFERIDEAALADVEISHDTNCAVGLYALRSRRRADAVENDRWERWEELADLDRRVGIVWQRYRSQACAFSRRMKSVLC